MTHNPAPNETAAVIAAIRSADCSDFAEYVARHSAPRRLMAIDDQFKAARMAEQCGVRPATLAIHQRLAALRSAIWAKPVSICHMLGNAFRVIGKRALPGRLKLVCFKFGGEVFLLGNFCRERAIVFAQLADLFASIRQGDLRLAQSRQQLYAHLCDLYGIKCRVQALGNVDGTFERGKSASDFSDHRDFPSVKPASMGTDAGESNP